jgi:hypothetical protein
MSSIKPHYFTKMCRYVYTGCSNLECNYAHTIEECKHGIEYAMKGVDFVEPLDVLDTFLPRFIVRFDDDEDDDTPTPMSTMSLSQIDSIQQSEVYKQTQKEYLSIRLQQLSKQRLWNQVREYIKLTMTYGEQDMEFSDEEMDCDE